jgi:hypothetical protein
MNKYLQPLPLESAAYVSNLEDKVAELKKHYALAKDLIDTLTHQKAQLGAETCFRALTALRDDYSLSCESPKHLHFAPQEIESGAWDPDECPLCKARKAIETIGNLFDKPPAP